MPLVDARALQDKRLVSHISEKERDLFPTHDQIGNLSGSRPLKELQVTVCLLLVELCEKFTFFGIVCNVILFCTVKLDYRNYQAAMVNLCFVGACMVTPVLMGWLAECLVGRIKLMYICMLLHFIGTALLPIVAFPFEDFYSEKLYARHLAKKEQKILFYVGLSATSLGSGGIRAIVCPFSAYNLEGHRPKELLSFFNRFYWLVNLSSAIVFLIISYIQQSVVKTLGFVVPFVSVLMALVTVHMARSEMIYLPQKGNSLLTAFGVFADALKIRCMKCRYISENVTNWLDHAKENYGGEHSETQVESIKALLRLFPLFASQILYRVCVMQMTSGYYLQTMNSNLNLNGFLFPIAAMNVISILPFLILVPVLECLNGCFFNAKTSGWFPTAYIVLGYVSAALAVMAAGFFEVHRKHFPTVEQTLSGKILLVSSMPCLHLAPQYVLLGVAEALVTPTCSLITFKFVPGGIRGIAMQVLTFFSGAGCFVGAFLVQATYIWSQGDWFPNILNEGKLERFYFFLASLMMISTLGFWIVLHRYNNLRQDYNEGFRGNLLQERLLQDEKSLKFYGSILECPALLSPVETVL
ncbi:solute carrier family 15 member 5 [Eublepharis macularius]|uniref:Solute carrier family 15 member 5 n=1 Tax=Eublepharis macularius TaxID=481883 RepID=A0AA97L707_EUBMA|nr:solute carrier family 15 member 5 [Eublepharis macularius]